MVEQRLAAVNAHFPTSNYNGRQVGAIRDDDVVIVGMARTAMTKAKRGAQKDTPLEDMLKVVFAATIEKSKIPADKIDEVIIGNVLAPGSAATAIRMAMFLAGIPHRASCQGINRMCSSGLQSVASIANAIKAGDIDIGIGGGVESMSNFDMQG
jgi:acetyl-CoA acyltransferase 1